MKRYRSADKNTGVIAYETAKDSISVKFRNGSVYIYTNESTGQAAIAEMKFLAEKGAGLTTYINQHTKDHYQYKLR